MTSDLKIIILVRFFGQAIFLTGLLGFIFFLWPYFFVQSKYNVEKALGVKKVVSSKVEENTIVPVSKEFGIVIEKIGANAKIIANVNPANEREYVAALQKGVAEALGSSAPGEPGNLYLFSHSTDAPWNIVRFNAIFYLLKELEVGDKVVIFYQNKRYNYIVFDKTLAQAGDVSFLTNHYDLPILTLQTCDPPGTLINRLIIRAKLASN